MAKTRTAKRHAHSATVETHSRFGRGWEAPALLLITAFLFCFGLVSVYSASAVRAQAQGLADYHFVVRQMSGGVVGFALLGAMAILDHRWLRLFAWPLLIGVIVMLLLTVLPGTESIAPETNGARRWLYLGPIGIQPSEFAKLALIAWTAALAVKKQDRLSSLTRGLGPFLLVWGIVVGLIAIQPSLTVAATALLLSLLVLFAAGARIAHFVALGVAGLPVLLLAIGNVAYRARRVFAFLNPEEAASGSAYQPTQALIAVGSGGVLGKGFGRGQQKFGFLPEPHNDYIFAMIGEEWGLVGLLVVLALFTGFALIGYRIAREARDPFSALLAVGLTNLIAVQAFLHMGVNLALLPPTGVTLPLVSYGRSSLLVCMVAVGILMNIARQSAARAE
jgi:cell division protein FtsW